MCTLNAGMALPRTSVVKTNIEIRVVGGPGAIATILGMTSLVKQSEFEVAAFAEISAAIVTTMSVTYLVLRAAKLVLSRIGPRGIDAATRIAISIVFSYSKQRKIISISLLSPDIHVPVALGKSSMPTGSRSVRNQKTLLDVISPLCVQPNWIPETTALAPSPPLQMLRP
jgi:MarC family integral membrane protein